ncbi:hypothetical protein [Natrinema sp. H-ect4]|uniref:hypothetical protein n=1 Tax=Natrinema sp. H-ect4 TaxID=3242699 RepID=UPI0035A94346
MVSRKQRALLATVVSTLLFVGQVSAFAGGDGSSSNPYQIETTQQLQDMQNDLSANYVLISDIDASGFSFSSVGDYSNQFTGVLDGQGYVVESLTIDEGNSDNVGLIGATGSGGELKNIGLVNMNITGSSWTGGLVGWNEGSISNSFSTGSVSGSTQVGGLLGYSSGSVSSSYSTGSVSGGDRVGGLVGNIYQGTVSDSYSMSSVSGDGYVGGLVGNNNQGTVSDSYSMGSVSGDSGVGGLVGNNGGSVSDSYWDTESSGQSSSAGGTGLTTSEMQGQEAETNMSGFDFTNNWSTVNSEDGDASADGYSILQDLDRKNQLIAQGVYSAFAGGSGTSSDPYQISNVDQLQDISSNLSAHYVLSSNIDASQTENWNNGNGFNPIGDSNTPFSGSLDGSGNSISELYINRDTEEAGLFGYIASSGEVANLAVKQADIVSSGNNIGVISGVNVGTISNSHTTGKVSNSGSYNVGGLVGRNEGDVLSSYSRARVIGGDRAGGLVGINDGSSAKISKSFGAANVTGGTNVGGLVGWQYGANISNSYSYSRVDGGDSVGGLAGYFSAGNIEYSYTAGFTSGDSNVGGLVGERNTAGDTPVITDSYWDINKSNQDSSAGGTGLYTSEMQTVDAESNMAGLDFSNTWNNLYSYPKLSWQNYESDNAIIDYYVKNCYDLQAIDRSLSQSYSVSRKIDCTITKKWENGKGFNPIGSDNTAFTGLFDGGDSIISNLYIDRPNEDNVGLFKNIKTQEKSGVAEIESIRLRNVNITGEAYVGAIAGRTNITLYTSSSRGTVNGEYNVGGLFGYVFDAEILNSFSTAKVTADDYSSGESFHAGGLVGRLEQGSISTSYSRGKIVSEDDAGGLVGFIQTLDGQGYKTSIVESYSTANVTVTGGDGDRSGGIAGNMYNVSFSSVYWNTETSGQSNAVGGSSNVAGTEGLQTDQMTYPNAADNLTGFNFDSSSAKYWITEEYCNWGYPYLNYNGNSVICNYPPNLNSVSWDDPNPTYGESVRLRINITDPDDGDSIERVQIKANRGDTTVLDGEATESGDFWYSEPVEINETKTWYNASVLEAEDAYGNTISFSSENSDSFYIDNSKPNIQSATIKVNESKESNQIELGLSSDGESDLATYQGLSSASVFTNTTLEAAFSFPLETNVSISDDVGLSSENQELDIRKTDSGHRQDPSCSSLTKQCLNQSIELDNQGGDAVDYSLVLEIPGTLDSEQSWSGTLNAKSATSHTVESHGDWITEKQYPVYIPEQVTIGENYEATRGLELSEQLGFTWSNISTTGFVDTPSSCNQANQTSISVNAWADENRTVGFSCNPGGIDTQSFDLLNKTDYEKAWNNISFTVSTNLTEESNITVPVDESNLEKLSDRDGGSLEAYVNGRSGNISLRDGNGTVFITVEDDFGNSSLHEGGHTAALTYTVGNDDSSGSAPAPIRQPPSDGNQTNYSVEFTTQDYYTVAPGSTSKIYFTVWNYEKEANSITLQTRDTTACSNFRVQSNFVGDKFSKNTSLKIPGTRDDLGAGGADVILMAKVNVPNRTELQSQGLGDTFTCRFDTGAGIGEAGSLNLTVQAVDTTPRWVKGVRQLIPDLPATSLMVREEICLPEGGENASRLEQVQRYLEEGRCSGQLLSVPLPTGEASAVIFGAFVFVAGITRFRGRVI